jgi:drug/metabolite transporter (DMT)-like permease
MLLFWLLGFYAKGKNSLLTIIAAAFFAFNILTFQGLSLTSPISASVIMVTTPMIVLFFRPLS